MSPLKPQKVLRDGFHISMPDVFRPAEMTTLLAARNSLIPRPNTVSCSYIVLFTERQHLKSIDDGKCADWV